MPFSIDDNEIYKTQEIAEMLGYKLSTVQKILREGKIPGKKALGKEYFVKGSDLRKAILGDEENTNE